MKKNNKGFTLIELLVVVAIIGILAAVGVVAYNGYTTAAKKSVTKHNHSIIYKTVLLETRRCLIDSSSNMFVLNGKAFLNCSDLYGSNPSSSKINKAMQKFFTAKFENAFNKNARVVWPGPYQGTCYPSGSQNSNLGEQGVHHLAVGVYPNSVFLIFNTCVEDNGKALTKEIELLDY